MSDKKWNVAYIQLWQTRLKGTLTVVMHYGVNIWCVRESPDLFSGSMLVPDKNVAYIHVVYSCCMRDKANLTILM